MRLSAPTNRTFVMAVILLAGGVASRLGYGGGLLTGTQTYWVTAAGGLLLMIGALFRKL